MEERLRFKVWNKRLKKMYDVRSMSYYKNQIVRIEVCEKYENGESDILIFDEYERMIDECVLLQCTGMKDDNNILIYEGDIIEIWKMAGNIHKNMFVKWRDSQSSFRLYDMTFATPQKIPYGDKRSMGAVTSMIIIGNIYENPELLEKDVQDE